MHRLKRLIRNLIRPATQLPHSSTGIMARRDRYQDIKRLLSIDNPVIVDGGAAAGTVTEVFLRQYSNPTIHAFEPRPSAAAEMKARYRENPHVTIHTCALGAKDGTLTFNVVDYATASSFLQPSATNRKYHPGLMQVEESLEVPVVRLDSVVSGQIDIVKLDLQGYELEALKGCGDLLAQTKIIAIEIEFVSLYEGQPLFGDIDVFLREHDFRLFNLYDLWTQDDGQLTAGDAVYLNTAYFRDGSA